MPEIGGRGGGGGVLGEGSCGQVWGGVGTGVWVVISSSLHH